MSKKKTNFPLGIAVFGNKEEVLGLVDYLAKRLKFTDGEVTCSYDFDGEFNACVHIEGVFTDENGNEIIVESVTRKEIHEETEIPQCILDRVKWFD